MSSTLIRQEPQKTLDLSTRGLESLPLTAIVHQPSLTYLNLSQNQLTNLPPEIGQLCSLTRLDLEHNELTTFPPEIGGLTALRALIAVGNQLTNLPKEIGRLTRLTTLSVHSNCISHLPCEIGNLSCLCLLFASYNRLSCLPPQIGLLPSLQQFSVGHNQLTEIPEEIGKLTNLRDLFAHNNSLTKLPETIGNLKSLVQFDLADNCLTHLPKSIGCLSFCKLFLNNNPLLFLPLSMKYMQRVDALKNSFSDPPKKQKLFPTLLDLCCGVVTRNKLVTKEEKGEKRELPKDIKKKLLKGVVCGWCSSVFFGDPSPWLSKQLWNSRWVVFAEHVCWKCL